MKLSPIFPCCLAAVASLAAEPAVPKFRAVTIDGKIQIGYGVAAADVDGDGKQDVLLADKKQFVWYRNPGTEKASDGSAWTKFLIAENLTEKDNVCLAAEDLDGDGRCELAVGAEWNPGDTEKSGAVFYLIPPADRMQKWEPVKFPSVEPTTHRMKWWKLDDGSWGLVVVPLHGRGNKNSEGSPVKVLLYRKPNDPRAEWKSEVVDESMHSTHNFHIQLPRALYLGGREGIARAIPGKDGAWMRDTFDHTKESRGVGELRIGRIGVAYFCAVEPMHGNELVFYPFGPGQSRRVLTDQLADGHALACGDLLGIGGDQIVVGWRGNPQKPRPVGIKLFTPLDPNGEKWREDFIDNNEMACEDLVLTDLNGDRRLDVVASGRSTRNIKIYLNETEK